MKVKTYLASQHKKKTSHHTRLQAFPQASSPNTHNLTEGDKGHKVTLILWMPGWCIVIFCYLTLLPSRSHCYSGHPLLPYQTVSLPGKSKQNLSHVSPSCKGIQTFKITTCYSVLVSTFSKWPLIPCRTSKRQRCKAVQEEPQILISYMAILHRWLRISV